MICHFSVTVQIINSTLPLSQLRLEFDFMLVKFSQSLLPQQDVLFFF
jgi:hypothetical protein